MRTAATTSVVASRPATAAATCRTSPTHTALSGDFTATPLSTSKAFVRFSNLAAYKLPDADPEAGQGSSDPYIVFIVRYDGKNYRGRTTTIQNPPRKDVTWKDESVTVAIPADISLEGSSLEVQVWDEDDAVWREREGRMVNDDDLMGVVPHVTHNGRTGLELDGRTFTKLDVHGHGKLYDFKISFTYEVYIPGLSPERAVRAAVATARPQHSAARAAAAETRLPFELVRLQTSPQADSLQQAASPQADSPQADSPQAQPATISGSARRTNPQPTLTNPNLCLSLTLASA